VVERIDEIPGKVKRSLGAERQPASATGRGGA
jgi:hypothetical protein